MIIKINNHTLLREIHQAFNLQFPFLQIAFFANSHQPGKANSKADKLPLSLTINEAGNPHKIGEFELLKNMTVAELESVFENQFGLHAQVLRKSGEVWLQTTVSDHLTLKELNTEAEAACNFVPDSEIKDGFREQI